MIPLQEPELAVKEAQRAVTELGHRGLFISPHPVDNRNLDHPAYEPLWSMAEELNVPALVHVSTGIRLPTAGAERFDRYCLFHLHAHPMEQMTAAASLILGGVLELHPRLRVGFMESGCGWVPYWLERMDEDAENYLFAVPYLKERPSDYFRRQCFVSFELEERSISYVAETVGRETLVFASDFPHHDCFYPGKAQRKHSCHFDRSEKSFLDPSHPFGMTRLRPSLGVLCVFAGVISFPICRPIFEREFQICLVRF